MGDTEPLLPSSMVFIDMSTGMQHYTGEDIKPDDGPLQDLDSKLIKEETANSKKTKKKKPYPPIQPRRVRCPECKHYTAENEEKLACHIRKIHRGENPFQCYMCDYSTYNTVRFEEHVRTHQGIKPYKCAHCPYRSVSKKNTQKHEKRHSDDNPYKCKQCGFLARHSVGLRHHEASHGASHATLSFRKCNLCHETFESTAYVAHRKRLRKCKDCQKRVCQSVLRQHRIDKHGYQIKVTKKPSVKTATFSCALCKWEGTSKPRILLHLIHHPNQEVDETVVDTSILKRLGIMN